MGIVGCQLEKKEGRVDLVNYGPVQLPPREFARTTYDLTEGELIVETLNEKLMDSGEDSVTDWSNDLAGRSKLPGALLAWTLTKSGHIVHWSTIHTQHVTTRHHLEPACSR